MYVDISLLLPEEGAATGILCVEAGDAAKRPDTPESPGQTIKEHRGRGSESLPLRHLNLQRLGVLGPEMGAGGTQSGKEMLPL